MTSWRIEPQQARAIVAQSEADADGISTATKTMESAIGQAIGALHGGTRSAAAIADVAIDPLGVDILAAKQQISVAIAATRAAIAAYEHGDEAMAADADRNVADVEWDGGE